MFHEDDRDVSNLFFLIACLLNIVLREYLTTSFVLSLSEYLSMVFDDSSDLEEIPDEVCVMHVVHAFKLALEVREKDQGSRRSMLS